MKITVDTNVLLRAVVEDDPGQQLVAIEALERAELAAVSLQSLCEFAWVLERSYGVARATLPPRSAPCSTCATSRSTARRSKRA